MSRQDRLAAVLAARAEQARRLAEGIDAAVRVRGDLEVLAEVLGSLRTDAEGSLSLQGLRRRVAEASTLVEQELARSQGTVARLNRPTLAIGVVGQARTGKSRFLQSLTGLGPESIPDSSGGFCTGVTSVIRPAPHFSAAVTFKTEAELLQQLVPYYNKLGLDRVPSDLAQVKLSPRPKFAEGEAAMGELYRHLAGYVDSLPEVREHLGRGTVPVAGEDIRDWVTQTDAEGRPQNGYRAVARMEISAPFVAGLEGLSVVDLPGLGDTNLSDAARMLAALEDDVDVVVIVRRPLAHGDDWTQQDVRLYERAAESLPGISMKERSFMALNRVSDPDNNEQCQRFQESAAERSLSLAGIAIVDASSVDEVAHFFDMVLEHLIENVGNMDGVLVSARLLGMERLTQHLESVLSGGRDWIGDMAETSPTHAREFIVLRNAAIEDLYGGLETLLREVRDQRDDPDESLQGASADVVFAARADKGLPSVDKVRVRIDRAGGKTIAYGELLNESRAHLSRQFVALEPALAMSLSAMNQQMADVVKRAHLGLLVDGDGEEWLMALAGELRLVLGEASAVREALLTLAGARLTYRGFLQHRIRPFLEGLTADSPLFPMENGLEYTANMILDMVEATYDDALGKVDVFLRGEVNTEPSRAVFAVGEEFVDRMLRSSTSEEEWHAVYQHYKSQIWPEQWAGLTEDRADVMKVQHLLDSLAKRSRALASLVAIS